MPRKAKRTNDLEFGNCIAEVFRRTTQEERRQIARDWCLGDYQAGDAYAPRGLTPIAAIVAALIDIEHPLLVSPGRGLMYSFVGCAVEVLRVEIRKEAVDLPLFDKVVHRVSVDSLCTGVDK